MTISVATATAANLTDTDMSTVKNALSSTGGIKLKGRTVSPEKIDALAQDFEAQFVTQMLSSMNTEDSKDTLGGSDSEDVYRSMLNTEYGKIIARTGGIGVADQVKQMMLSQQEVGN